MTTAIKHESFSSLNQFDQCAAWFHAERVEKVEAPPSELRETGILIHDVAERYVRHLDETGRESDMDSIAQIIEDTFAHSTLAGGSTRYYKGVTIGARIFGKAYRHVAGSVIALEEWLEGSFGEGLPPLVARSDMLTREEDDKGSFIGDTDLKSGWSTEQTDANLYQLDTRGMLLRQKYPDERLKVRNFFIRAGMPTEWREISEYDIDNARRRTVAIHKRKQAAFEANDFPATPGSHCTLCPIAMSCAKAKGLEATGHLALTYDVAQQQVLETQVLAQALKSRKESLKKFVDTNGPVVAERANERGIVERLEAAYKLPDPTPTIEDLPTAFERMGSDVFKLFGAPLKGALKKAENDERLSGLWVVKQGRARFTVGKLGDDDE